MARIGVDGLPCEGEGQREELDRGANCLQGVEGRGEGEMRGAGEMLDGGKAGAVVWMERHPSLVKGDDLAGHNVWDG